MINLQSQNWQIENIETVLFDKDGTFVDLDYFWGKVTELRVKEVIKKYKLTEERFEKLCLFLGYNCLTQKMLSDGITALYSRQKIIEIFTKNLEELNIFVEQKEIEEIFNKVTEKFNKECYKYTKPINSAIEFIKKLRKKGIKLGVVTSDSLYTTELTLKHFGWDKYFDVVIGRESTTQPKESGEGIKLALKKIKANPQTTIMIGDAPMDYIAATNAGLKATILVSTGQININELRKTSNYVVKTLKEIEHIKF